MSGRTFTPSNQIKLTNVAVVRIKKTGKRFEIACYRNKVVAWRNGVEKNIDEVLQTHTVFSNVSKGQVAKKEDILKAFQMDNQTEICKIILQKGELQVSDKERNYELDARFKEIAYCVTNMTINTQVNLPFSIATIEKAMRDVHYSIRPHQNTKQQALTVIKLLIKDKFPIERVQMRLRVFYRGPEPKKLKALIEKMPSVVWENETLESGLLDVTFLANPGHYADIDKMVREESKGVTRVEVVCHRVELSDEIDIC